MLAAALPLRAETEISGTIEKNSSWSPKLSPYVISGEVTVGVNAFLTMYPGTTVKFKEGGKLVVKGTLHARGDRLNPVRFLPYDNESFYEGVILQGRKKSVIEHAIMIRGAITTEAAPLGLNNCYILNSTGVLLKVYSDADIKDNYFYNNTYGVYVEGKNAKFSLVGNTFNRNRFAVYLKEMTKDGAVINGNNFFDNKVSVANYTPDTVMAKNNYWGTAEEKDIARQIFEKKNNPKVGEVTYRPFAKTKLAVYEPPEAFLSLVKIYLSLKRPDEEPVRFAIGAGADYLYMLAPEWVNNELDFGKGIRAEFTFNITGYFKGGIEAEVLSGDFANEDYKFNFSLTQFLATFYSYIGWQKNIYFVPYAKIGMGVGLISAEWRSLKGLPIYDGETSKKYNELNYAVFGGLGCEYFVTRFFSIKAEALYNCTTSRKGAVMFPMANLSACFYFDTPFIVNTK